MLGTNADIYTVCCMISFTKIQSAVDVL